MSTPNCNYDVQRVQTQRDKDVPVVDRYVFFAKDTRRIRFRCKTPSCKTTLLLYTDTNGRVTSGNQCTTIHKR